MQQYKPDRRRHLFIFFCTVTVIVIVGIGLHLRSSWALNQEATEDAVPTVAVVKVAAGPATEELVLPGNVKAWHESPIYARTSGYLKNWKTDIGTKVRAGELLAQIETPEVDAQLRQIEADLKTVEATSALAATTAERWKELLKTDSVSKQEFDEKTADAAAKNAALASARANRDRLRQLVSFKRVVAPFSGIITARNTDDGALINAGSAGVGQELFRIADTKKLRIYVQVPQNYTAAISPKLTAELNFAEHPGKTFQAKLFKTADAIDPTSRTLLAQFVTDNQNAELMPGGYTEVHIKLASTASTVRLPVNTLIFQAAGLQVATVDKDNHIMLKPVVMGRDFGNEVEIKSGLEVDETVIINPSDSISNGQQVRISMPKKESEKKS